VREPPAERQERQRRVPDDVVGKRLDQAENELEGMGIQFSHETLNGEETILPFGRECARPRRQRENL
jgi:hypothetical protein